jgi:septal ring factor EnvC (AmiA/AmiB activator)
VRASWLLLALVATSADADRKADERRARSTAGGGAEDDARPRARRNHAHDRIDVEHPRDPRPEPRPPALEPREAAAAQLAAEAETIDRTLAIVDDKLAIADAARVARIRVAYRVLADPIAASDDRMAVARRRAAAQLLLARDASERGLLADEAARLHAAAARTAADRDKLAELTFPAELAWPARGSIARHFGTYVHERSKATLSRRGIDIEVDDHAVASAPADGVVRYAGMIRGLEHGVIIDHGDYLTVIAKLGDLAIPAGTVVHRGERLGRAARHRVYLEVRVKVGPGGLPIDPEPLVSKPVPKR